MAEDDLRTVVMLLGMESELAGLLVNRPARKAARDFLHVLLSVAAIDAERMQLHDLAGVILVDAAFLRADLRHGRCDRAVSVFGHLFVDLFGDHLFHRRDRVRDGIRSVIEIEEHRGLFAEASSKSRKLPQM